ncbi:MAG: endopeptidase La [Acidobacteriota bacterium]
MPKDSTVPISIPERLPVWDSADKIIFPYALDTLSMPLPEARPLLEASHKNEDLMVLLPPGNGKQRRSSPSVGTVLLLLRMGPGNPGEGLLVVQGVARAELLLERKRGAFRWARVRVIPDQSDPGAAVSTAAVRRSLLERIEQLSGTPRGLASDVRTFLASIDSPGRFSDLLSAQLALPLELGLNLLASNNPLERLKTILSHLATEMEIANIQERLNRQTREEMDRRQREYYLRQQLEAIQSELAAETGEPEGEGYYRKQLKELSLPEEVDRILGKEISRLDRYSPFSEELSQLKAYLDLVFDLPWNCQTTDKLDLKQAAVDLDRDHYGLKKVKDRILEHLAVSKLRGRHGGTIFCFVGPPGVGKTSLGRAIARTVGRKFVRMSLGGVRDEAEIRGHRRTYVGAMPGRIIQGIKNAGSMNPVFVLDEVDKMVQDWHGDPSSALLEALDPEQNREFVDHFLGFPFDLSDVMFVATANTLEGIHPAFLDRMEILEIPGYTEEEKLVIAKRHILPKQIGSQGLDQVDLELPDAVLLTLIRSYTREAGVRNLERAIETVLRKVARKVAEGRPGPFKLKDADIRRMMGPPPFFQEERLKEDRAGVATGLAWTEMGGELLFVEATALEGTGALTLTGQLGEVMKESVQAALTFLKERAKELHLAKNLFSKRDLHVHVPEGAIPKDGPSAGITMAVAMLSTLSGRPVDRSVAFTGEITLRGEVLPVGGLREKLLAAHRAGLKKIVLPYANKQERREFPKSVLRDLDLVFVKTMDEVFPHALKAKPPVRAAARARRKTS